MRGAQQVWFAWHTLAPEHLQSTEPQAFVTVLPHEVPHVGRVQQVLLAAAQALPVPQEALHTLLPQVFINVTPHCVPQVGNAQQVWLVASHAVPLAQPVAGQTFEPQLFMSVTPH